jgi:hypothetical protein
MGDQRHYVEKFLAEDDPVDIVTCTNAVHQISAEALAETFVGAMCVEPPNRAVYTSNRMLKFESRWDRQMIPSYYDAFDPASRSERVRGDDQQSGHLFSYYRKTSGCPPSIRCGRPGS